MGGNTRSMKASEHEQQKAYFQWVFLKENENEDYKMIFAIPNGGLRHLRVAQKLKDEGVRAGVWDIFCCVPRYPWSGLWLEMKVKPNKLTDNQIRFGEMLEERGFKTAVCYSWEDAKQQTEIYLENDL